MITSQSRIIVIMPSYEDSAACNETIVKLAKILHDRLFVIIVDDGSLYHPVDTRKLKNICVEGAILRLRKNYGHQYAIAVGMIYVSSFLCETDTVVIMDSDGNDNPDHINLLLNSLNNDEFDVVVAKRGKRIEGILFRSLYYSYIFLFYILTGKIINFGNYLSMKPLAVKRLIYMDDLSNHIAATILNSKLRVQKVNLNKSPRNSGLSKMNFVSLTLHGLRGLTVFIEKVILRVGLVCLLVAMLSAFGIFAAIVLKLTNHATPGWFSTFSGVLFLMLIQTAALSLILLLLSSIARGNMNVVDPMSKLKSIEKIDFLGKASNV